MSKAQPATIEDVARIAEVSIATVSRAIHMPEKVAAATRLKVNQAIAIVGYTPNALAQNLRLGRSNMILVVAPDIGDPNFISILIGLENEARNAGLGVLIGHTQNDAQRALEYLNFFNSNRASGLVLFTGLMPFGAPSIRPPPTVGVFEPIHQGGIPYVGVDDRAGARKLADLLIAEGHRSIAFIGNSKSRLAFARRHAGYMEGLLAAGIKPRPHLVLDGDGTLESGRLAIEQFFLRDTLPTAFMCVNDQTAIGTMLALSARGYSIPEDFSVTGFDDVPQAALMSPPLTTIRQPRTAIGQNAITLLTKLIAGETVSLEQILLTPELAVRNSVCPPKG